VDCLYSLYDALVSVTVPSDKGRAVVDAMELDMSTTIATKADLQLVKSELRQEIQLVKTELRQEIQLVKTELKAGICKESHAITLRLGSAMVAVTGLLFVALKLTS
jgi:hypothetical protein